MFANRVNVEFEWCPVYNKVLKNEKADLLAKNVTKKGWEIQFSSKPFSIFKSIVSQKTKSFKVIKNISNLLCWDTSQFVKFIDKKISESHTSLVYNGSF